MKSLFEKTIFAIVILFGAIGYAGAATFTVTKTADTNDGVCDADCSLREAIAAVNADTSTTTVHRIEFSSLFNTPQTIAIVSTRLRLEADTRVEIIGLGNHNVALTTDPGTQTGVLRIESTYARIFNIRFADAVNTFTIGGGAISIGDFVQDVEIEECLFENNTAERGGAIDSFFAALTITNSTFRNNRSTEYEGAAVSSYSQRPTIVSGSTFSANLTNLGGVLSIYTDSSVNISVISNSTFSGNHALDTFNPASTIFNAGGDLNITNVTVVYNSTTGGSPNNTAIGGSAFNQNSTSLTNSIVMGNQTGTLGNVTQTGPNDIGLALPALDSLAWNGGPTQTHSLQAGSTAIDSGSAVSAPVIDQRGVARPQGAGIDLGAFESGLPISATTPTGSNVPVTAGSVSVTFSGVSSAGSTSQIPILPSTAGTVPGGYSLGAGFPAFEISTTASYTAPLVVCIQVSPATTLAVFNTLRIMHNEGGTLVDRTILSPATPAPDFATKTICALVSSLSPFVVAERLAPTAANVSITGRTVTAKGSGIRNVQVVLTDSRGLTRIAFTSSFGYYKFTDISAGEIYVLSVINRKYQFDNPTRIIFVSEDLVNQDFIGEN